MDPAKINQLINLIESNSLCDVWRLFYSFPAPIYLVHVKDNYLSLARLDRFYCFKHQTNVLRNCSIQPVGISDHSFVLCNIFIKDVKCKSGFWHLMLLCLRQVF